VRCFCVGEGGLSSLYASFYYIRKSFLGYWWQIFHSLYVFLVIFSVFKIILSVSLK